MSFSVKNSSFQRPSSSLKSDFILVNEQVPNDTSDYILVFNAQENKWNYELKTTIPESSIYPIISSFNILASEISSSTFPSLGFTPSDFSFVSVYLFPKYVRVAGNIEFDATSASITSDLMFNVQFTPDISHASLFPNMIAGSGTIADLSGTVSLSSEPSGPPNPSNWSILCSSLIPRNPGSFNIFISAKPSGGTLDLSGRLRVNFNVSYPYLLA